MGRAGSFRSSSVRLSPVRRRRGKASQPSRHSWAIIRSHSDQRACTGLWSHQLSHIANPPVPSNRHQRAPCCTDREQRQRRSQKVGDQLGLEDPEGEEHRHDPDNQVGRIAATGREVSGQQKCGGNGREGHQAADVGTCSRIEIPRWTDESMVVVDLLMDQLAHRSPRRVLIKGTTRKARGIASIGMMAASH